MIRSCVIWPICGLTICDVIKLQEYQLRLEPPPLSKVLVAPLTTSLTIPSSILPVTPNNTTSRLPHYHFEC